MADHYIYEPPDKECLCQGDVLERSPALIELLQKVHPHYADHQSYGYFVILTQTCDLVRRGGSPPSSPYITLAAARPVEQAIIREAKKHQQWWEECLGLLDSRAFDQMVLFAEGLLNNNIPNYFYLHEDLSLGISGQHCVFIALAITLKIDHYEICRAAKIGQMKEIFRAKLGWLVGNMYSRVGTPDWDDEYGKNASRKEASLLVRDNFVSIDKESKDRAIRELTEQKALSSCSPEEIWEKIKEVKKITRRKEFSDRINELFEEKIKIIDPICGRLSQDISKNDELVCEVRKILRDYNPDEPEKASNQIISIFSSHLRSYLSEQGFPGRKKIVRRIIETIKQDSIIKRILE